MSELTSRIRLIEQLERNIATAETDIEQADKLYKSMEAEVARLTAERDAAKANYEEAMEHALVRERENAALCADRERLDWMEKWLSGSSATLRETIDAARKTEIR
jgi:outer membrane protein TolC